MRNAKLRSGAIGVSSGVGILKDWTAVAGVSENLLAGIEITDIEGAVIEFRGLRGAGELGMNFFANGSTSPVANGYNKVALQTKSYSAGSNISNSNNRLLIKDDNYYEGAGKVSLYGVSGVWPHGISLSYFSELEYVNNTPAVVVVKNLVTVYQSGSKNIASLAAVLTGNSDADGVFAAEYRIVKK